MTPITPFPTPAGIVQIAYHAPDIEAAALRFARQFGWGPFFIARHLALHDVTYRGRPTMLDTSSAFGQAGPLMIEIVQQHDDTPSAFRDMYRADQFGLHHFASFTPDVAAASQRHVDAGFAIASSGSAAGGLTFAMIDLRTEIGAMLELYPELPVLAGLYGMVREASLGWDGREPVRELAL